MDIIHESIADIPLIIAFLKRIEIQTIVDKAMGNHGNRKGLLNGQLAVVWIAYILTQNNHCKSPVAEWVQKHLITLEALMGAKISETDFEDTRLSRFLEKLANNSVWDTLENLFYQDSFSILKLDVSAPKNFKEELDNEIEVLQTIKLDSTTAYGHHEVKKDCLMQLGWSKDHRPDLPQLKIMASVEGKTGVQIATDVVPGNQNDDPLYIPILEKTRKIMNTTSCLICGDCKMSAMYIRANIVCNKEFYLTPLQLSNNNKKLLIELVETAVDGSQGVEIIMDIDDKNKPKVIGAGFEISRKQNYLDIYTQQKIEWEERVIITRSSDYAKDEINRFNKKLEKIQNVLINLESNFFFIEEEAKFDLLEKIKKIPGNEFLVYFTYEILPMLIETETKRTEKRNGKIRNGSYTIKRFKAKITNITEILEITSNLRNKMGWRLYVTNAKKSILKLTSAYKYYRQTMYVVEIGFHVLKDSLQISPLFVRNPSQIIGMTKLLILGLKIQTSITAELRSNMQKENSVLTGLYPGQPVRKHSSPTGQSLLKYFSRQELALICSKMSEKWYLHMTPLTETCRSILTLLKIPNAYDEFLLAATKIMGEKY